MRTVLAVVALLVVAACGPDDSQPSTKPSFGGATPSEVDQSDLAAARGTAGIRSCPILTGSSDLPDLTLDCLGEGNAVTLSGIEGPAVVNLWASWCAPCREELPLLARADEAYAGVQFLGIDVADEAPDAAIELAELSGVTYPQVVDRDRSTQGAIRYQGLPATVFVAADGSTTTVNAPFDSYDDLTDAIETMLGVTR